MENTPNLPSDGSKKKGIIIAVVVIILAAAIGTVCWFIFRDKPSDSGKKPSKQASATEQPASPQPAATNDKTDSVSGTAADASPSKKPSIEDAPEPTQHPNTLNDTVKENDPEPEVESKQHQKKFNDCMAAGDYAGAKAELDSYFATSAFAISGGNTFFNYVYFYEKQGLYQESALYQLDFLEKEMGLDNIIADNTRYQHLQETLKYVTVDDPRIEQIEASVARWKEIEDLLANNKIDPAIEKLKGYISGGMHCVYAYNYLGQAYHKKPDYLAEGKTYYIMLLKLQEREKNALERSFEVVFIEHVNALYDNHQITDQEKTFLEDNMKADMLPFT